MFLIIGNEDFLFGNSKLHVPNLDQICVCSTGAHSHSRMMRCCFSTSVQVPQLKGVSNSKLLCPWSKRPVCATRALESTRQARRSSTRPSFSAQKRHSSPFRPKQSLAQNFLKDENIIQKIATSFRDAREQLCPDSSVIEIGAGAGALTGKLYPEYHDMLAVEIDWRAVEVLNDEFPSLEVHHGDVLDVNLGELSLKRGAPLAIIGNLPYNIVSQILFSMLEAPRGSIGLAIVMMQKEVAERICAKTRTKSYGILSVVGQLYSKPRLLFDVPSTAFYPKPSVKSTMVLFEFEPAECIDLANTNLTSALRKVIRSAFQQRRKTLRNSLKTLEVPVPEEWASKRPEELSPEQFVELTRLMYGDKVEKNDDDTSITPVWRSQVKATSLI